MFAFVIPLKPAINSKDWKFESALLRATILSMLAQVNGNFIVIVVYHDLPLNRMEDPKLIYEQLPAAYLSFDQIPEAEEWLAKFPFYKKKGTEYLYDQGRKQMYGAQLAKNRGCEFIMCVDGDDLVSKNLVGFILDHRAATEAGWYVDKGFFHLYRENIFVRHPQDMNWRCGSSHIVHRDFIPVYDINDRGTEAWSFFAHHPYLRKKLMDKYGKDLKPIPFYAIIYTITHLNWWISIKRQFGASYKHRLIYLLRRVYFPARIYRNFYIAPLTERSIGHRSTS